MRVIFKAHMACLRQMWYRGRHPTGVSPGSVNQAACGMMQSPGLGIMAMRPQASDAVSQSLNFLRSKVRVISHASPDQEAWMR